MKRQFISCKQCIGLAALLAGLLVGGSVIAQPPPGGPPRFGRGFGGGRGQMTAATVPLDVLTAGLKLSAGQAAKIKTIQAEDHDERSDLEFQPPAGGGRPDPSVFQAAMAKIQALNKKTEGRIQSVLNADQKKEMPLLMQQLGGLRSGGVPVELYTTLGLTGAQKQKIALIGKQSQSEMQTKMQEAMSSGDRQGMREVMQQIRQQSHDRIMAVLSATQKAQVDKYIQDHPRPQGRGPGGPGGPPPGGA